MKIVTSSPGFVRVRGRFTRSFRSKSGDYTCGWPESLAGRALSGMRRRGRPIGRGDIASHFFSYLSDKFFASARLAGRGRGGAGQNLEPQGVAGKILREKELGSGSRLAVEMFLAHSAGLLVLKFSVKVIRHTKRIYFRRPVEKIVATVRAGKGTASAVPVGEPEREPALAAGGCYESSAPFTQRLKPVFSWRIDWHDWKSCPSRFYVGQRPILVAKNATRMGHPASLRIT